MSVGKTKKFTSFDELEKELNSNTALQKETESTRLYKSKDARIKKDLSFKTKANKSKLT